MSQNIASADGKLGILLPGMGAVATTLIAGVLAVNKGISKPIGSTSQMGTIRICKRTENNTPLIKDFIPLANLKNIKHSLNEKSKMHRGWFGEFLVNKIIKNVTQRNVLLLILF